jgi:hypothetical protein
MDDFTEQDLVGLRQIRQFVRSYALLLQNMLEYLYLQQGSYCHEDGRLMQVIHASQQHAGRESLPGTPTW